ncbi:hypothetical protein QQ045_018930 [Rhodiola kirilowii]
MDWSKPISTRTRKSQALYFRELHKRIKLERSSSGGGGYGRFMPGSDSGGSVVGRSSSGGGGYGRFMPGSDSGGSVVGGLKQLCSEGVAVGRKRNSGSKRKGKTEAISDEEEDDDVVFVGSGGISCSSEGSSGRKVGVRVKDSGAEVKLELSGRKRKGQIEAISDEDDDVVFVGSGGCSNSEERSGAKVGVHVKDRGAEVKLELSGCKRKGKIEAISDKDDDVVFVGGGGYSNSEERSGDKVGVRVKDNGAEVEFKTLSSTLWSRSKGEDAVLITEDKESEGKADEVRMGTEAKVEEDDDDVLINDDEKNEEEEDKLNEVVSESDEEEEHVDDVDSDRMSDSDYEVTESSKEMEHDDGDDDDGCYFAAKADEKIDCSYITQESGRWIYWNENQEENGWIAYYTQVEYCLDSVEGDEESIYDIGVVKTGTADCSYITQESGRWIYWNEDQEGNGWIAYYTQVEYCSDSVEGDEESIYDIGVVKTGTADGDTQRNSTLKKHIKVKNDTHNDWVGTSKNDSFQFITGSKSRLNSKKTADGSLKRPFCIGVEEEDDDDVNSIPKQMAKRGKLEKSNKLKRSRPSKCYGVSQVLLDSMLNENDGSPDELASQQHTISSTTKKSLPLKFTFGVPNTNPPQKSESEKNLDGLWAEFDFALTASDIGSTAFNMEVDQKGDSIPEQASENTTSYCHNGQHDFVIDEEIGEKCRYCSVVRLEIRHFMPSFSKYPYGRSEKKHMKDEDDYVGFDEIPSEDVGCNSHSDCGQHTYAKGTVWDLIPGIRQVMHLHQQEGFEFIWKNIAGGIHLNELHKRTCSDSGNGCIISHAPGTGKSLLTIVFIQTYMKLYPTCRPVIIAPYSMLLSWEAELRHWKVDIPFHNLSVPDLTGKENTAAINLLGRANHHINIRLLKLYSWKKDGGILGLSYKLYESLAGENRVDGKRKGRKRSCHYDREIRKILLETPNLLVLDEGHTPRNERSLIWKTLCKIQTEKRIILSGTPFQNNFEELFNTLCLVRPKFADSIQSDCYEMRRSRGRKVSAAKGKWCSLTSPIGKFVEGKVSDYNLEELKYMLESFVHIYKGNILQKTLPGLRDSVIVLRPFEFQKSILEDVYHMKNGLKRNYVASLVSLHPSLLPESERIHFPRYKDKFERLRLNPEAGVKAKFLMELIRLSKATNEKVLVFSEYIDPLKFTRDLLKSHFGWAEGEEILYMNGQMDVKQRQSSINTFNDLSSAARVLLASTRACSEGISLVGASRVVLLDVVWNPSVERQAISRAYRLGQQRVVHVYHLISGTMEWDKYYLQAKKSLLSDLVFSSTDRDENAHVISDAVSDDNILEEMANHSSLKDMFEKIIHQPKESSLIETFGLVSQEGTF